MTTPIEEFFEHIVLINLARRPDRLSHASHEFDRLKIHSWERFNAIDAGPDDGNRGCTTSHRAVMGMIIERQWPRCLVFEDDFAACIPDAQEWFARMVPGLPADWEMFYLGGGYGEMPQGWVSKHIIRIGEMKTTSSYGVTLETAKRLYDLIPADTCDSIDNLYAGYNKTRPCFITEPRLFVQYANYSDLQKRVMDNGPSMLDRGHVSRLQNNLPT